jgi:prophage regulatory protein
MSLRMIRKPEVLRRTGLQKSQLDVAIKDGRFPNSVPVLEGGRAQAWFEDEVDAYIESRRQARDAAIAATPPNRLFLRDSPIGQATPVEKPVTPVVAKSVKVQAKRSNAPNRKRRAFDARDGGRGDER